MIHQQQMNLEKNTLKSEIIAKNHIDGLDFEAKFAAMYGCDIIPGSGCGSHYKGDLQKGSFLIQLKLAKEPVLKSTWFLDAWLDAQKRKAIPVLVVKNGNDILASIPIAYYKGNLTRMIEIKKTMTLKQFSTISSGKRKLKIFGADLKVIWVLADVATIFNIVDNYKGFRK